MGLMAYQTRLATAQVCSPLKTTKNESPGCVDLSSIEAFIAFARGRGIAANDVSLLRGPDQSGSV